VLVEIGPILIDKYYLLDEIFADFGLEDDDLMHERLNHGVAAALIAIGKKKS